MVTQGKGGVEHEMIRNIYITLNFKENRARVIKKNVN